MTGSSVLCSGPIRKWLTRRFSVSIVLLLVWACKGAQGNNPPRLVNFDGYAQAVENAPVGTLLKTLTATDADGPNEITFQVDPNSQDTKDLVYLDPATGSSSGAGRSAGIRLKIGNLNRDNAPTERQLSFYVLDGLNSPVTARMVLYIQDINDVAPQFYGTPYRTSIREDTPVGTLVFNDTSARDPDSGIGGSISYSLELTDLAYRSTFRTAPYTGQVFLNGSLDYEAHNFYQLQLTATDGGGLNSTTDVIITIEDVQDTKPYFVNTPYTALIKENATVGTSVLTVSALDGDRGKSNPIKYSFVNYTGGDFNISEETGVIRVARTLDSNTPELRNQGSVFDLTVLAKETQVHLPQFGETSATMLVLITIQDVNDHAPQFNKSFYNASVSENAQAGIPVQLNGPEEFIHVQDLDQNDNSRFEVSVEKDGLPYNVFSLRPTIVFSEGRLNMLVENSSVLDYEALTRNGGSNILQFKVKAKETHTAEKRTGEATFTVYVRDENDNFPQFTQSSYEVYVKEQSPAGTTVTTISASDEDSGPYGQVTYHLQRGGEGKFRVDPDGTVVVVNGTGLDRETLPYYYLTVEARDGGGNRNTSTLIINLNDTNDQAPVFLRSQYTSFVAENAPFPPLLLSATDADEKGTVNSEVAYNLSYIPPTLRGNISIETINGQGKISIDPPLDFEALVADGLEFIRLEVTASDKGVPAQSTAVNVTITVEDKNDNSPIMDQSSYQGLIDENAPAGTAVVNVSATDQDGEAPNNDIQYSIEKGGQDKFFINPSSGKLEVAFGARFDRDVQSTYNLTVVARDKGFPQQSGTAEVTVTVGDINNKPPVFQPAVVEMSVQENASSMTSVGRVKAVDPDKDPNLTYEILGNLTEGVAETGTQVTDSELTDVKSYFRINESTGEITVLNNILDRETAETVKLTIRVTDNNAHPAFSPQTATGTVQITLEDYNDNAPEFSMPQGYSRNVSEREDRGYEILTVSATDADKNQHVKFKFPNPSNSKFNIDENGKITLREKLDRETTGSHTFTVIAYDDGTPSLSSNTTVTITVLDQNDNNPQFRPFNAVEVIAEHSPVNDSIIQFQATDADIGKYGDINYFIETGNEGNKFRLDRVTGELFVNGDLDREVKDQYQLRIQAIDNYEDPEPINRRTNTTTFTVQLADINDNSPVFNTTTFVVTEEVREDRSLGTFVYTITATDKDIDNNGKITYSLDNGENQTNATNANGLPLFRIEGSTGKITVAQALNDIVGLRYFTVIATDGGSTRKSASAMVLVDIKDVNFYSPVFEVPRYINVEEAGGVGAFVFMFNATDRDQGRNGRIDYELITNGDRVENNSVFRLDRTTGNLTTKIDLDYETAKQYTIRVRAKDQAEKDPKSSEITVNIYVTDKDDNPPKFDPAQHPRDRPLELSISENRVGTVGRVEAFDVDSSNTSNICYCFVGNHTGFSLDKTTGEIKLDEAVDRETNQGPFDLVIKALQYCQSCDAARRKRRSIAAPSDYDINDETMLWVRVNIKDVNDNKPVFQTQEISVGITRDTQYGEDVIALREYVEDADEAGNNSRHNYVIVDGIKANLDNLGQENVNDMFRLSTSGNLKTNTYFKADWFGFFYFTVRVSDSAGNTSANVKVYLVNKDQQVKIVILGSPDSVNKSKGLIVEKLENVTDGLYDIIVDKVRTHEDAQGNPDPFKTDLFIHGVERTTQKVLDGADLLRLIDSKIRLLIETYKKYAVVEVLPAVPATQGQSEELTLKMALILVAVLLTMLVIVLALSFFFCRKKYKRKLRAATAMAFGTKESEMNKMDMPGTNLHAFEGSNPIWMEKYDNIGVDDNNSQNSLDANEVELSPQNLFDEQEVAMDLYNDDYDNFNKLPHSKLGAADLHLNAALREHEASKNNKNKDIANNNADKYAVNGSVKYSNGSVDSLSTFNTKNVNGLQTTEI